MLIENAKFISTKIIYLSNLKTKKLEIAFFKTLHQHQEKTLTQNQITKELSVMSL